MLIRFWTENCLSLRDKQELSFVASSLGKQGGKTVAMPGGNTDLLCAAAIYGGNASGKTNVINAFSLIFHFQDYNKPGNQNQVRKELRKYLSKYNKELPYEKMSPNYVKAVERAKASVRNRAAEGDPEGDPSTTVFKLTETIKKFGKK